MFYNSTFTILHLFFQTFHKVLQFFLFSSCTAGRVTRSSALKPKFAQLFENRVVVSAFKETIKYLQLQFHSSFLVNVNSAAEKRAIVRNCTDATPRRRNGAATAPSLKATPRAYVALV